LLLASFFFLLLLSGISLFRSLDEILSLLTQVLQTTLNIFKSNRSSHMHSIKRSQSINLKCKFLTFNIFIILTGFLDSLLPFTFILFILLAITRLHTELKLFLLVQQDLLALPRLQSLINSLLVLLRVSFLSFQMLLVLIPFQ
jgi:hypothetical protein